MERTKKIRRNYHIARAVVHWPAIRSSLSVVGRSPYTCFGIHPLSFRLQLFTVAQTGNARKRKPAYANFIGKIIKAAKLGLGSHRRRELGVEDLRNYCLESFPRPNW